MNTTVRTICIALFFTLANITVDADTDFVTVATWNLNNLHHTLGVPLRPRAPARSPADYAVLRKYVSRLNADVVALQEVNGPLAARLVFPAQEYEFYFSGRYEVDLQTGRSTDGIYTGFAVRRGVFSMVEKGDYPALGVEHNGSRTVRWGTDLTLHRGPKRLRLLSVHLKSGCFTRRLDRPRSDACRTLASQLAPLETWIDERVREGIPFGVLGDFNRALDYYGERDHLWQEIDDGDPSGLKLWRLPSGEVSKCWRDTRNYRKNPVDFMVFDDRAWRLVDRPSFRQMDYDPRDRILTRNLPSDHCLIAVNLRF